MKPDLSQPTSGATDSTGARLIHIIGPHGSGKTRMAAKLVARCEAEGRRATTHARETRAPLTAQEIAALRVMPVARELYTKKPDKLFDVIHVCHQREPQGLTLEHGDDVIRLEASHA